MSKKRYRQAQTIVSDTLWSIRNSKEVLSEAEARVAKKYVARFVVSGAIIVVSFLTLVCLYLLVPVADMKGQGNWALATMIAPATTILISVAIILHIFYLKSLAKESLLKAQHMAKRLEGDLETARKRFHHAETEGYRREKEKVANGGTVSLTTEEYLLGIARYAAEATEREWYIFRTNQGKMAPHISTLVDDWKPSPILKEKA